MLKRILLALFVMLTAIAFAPTALAKPSKQDVVLAKKAIKDAKKHEKAGDWEEAREAWQKAVDLNDTADARVGLSKAEAKLGHLLLAEEHLKKALEDPKAKRKAEKELKALEEKIPTLKIEPPAEFSGTLKVDDEEKAASALTEPLRLDPGQHTVQAEAEGYKPFSETVVLEEGDKKDLTILMTELPKPVAASEPTEEPEEEQKKSSGSTQKTLGWVSLAIGGAGVIVGTVMGLQARSTRNELDDACADDVCTEQERDLYDKGKRQADFATAGFIVGGVGIGLGTVLLLTAGGGDETAEPAADEARIEPVIGPGQLGVRGRF
jgi:tetratricopeptide (TPR) repeat protein